MILRIALQARRKNSAPLSKPGLDNEGHALL